MIDVAVIALRLVQYLTGSILLGSALFFVYALSRARPAQPWERPLFLTAAVGLALSAVLGLVAQAIALAGSIELGLASATLHAMAATSLGKAAIVRAGAALAAVPLLLLLKRGSLLWCVTGLLGAVAVASFAWMGHGAASEGAGAQIHLIADLTHALFAALWIGALIGFVMLALSGTDAATMHLALARFSAVGIPLVVLLAATGLVNSWFLVGLNNLGALLTTNYGRLLSLKLLLFTVMLLLAAVNRWRHTPEIHRTGASGSALRASITVEATLGIIVLALVAWFGMLEPPAS